MTAVSSAGQQNAELFKTFSDGGDRLCQVQIALRGPPRRLAVRQSIGRINTATGKDIGTGGKTGRGRAARHQHLDAAPAVAQQQHGSSREQGRRFALCVKELRASCHGRILPASVSAQHLSMQPLLGAA